MSAWRRSLCPLTSQLHPAVAIPIEGRCGGGPEEVAIDQIRTISKFGSVRKSAH